MTKELRKYMAKIGRKGGLKSRRRLSREQARTMVRIREAQKAYQRYYASCFWSYKPNLRITAKELPWVIEQLRKNGGIQTWRLAARLCP